MRNLLNKRGFTLIELLIVVAIIAILAAIAIPNFLAAQIRAKVSQTKAAMQTAATALESYYVDNNTYPGTLANGAGWKQNSWTIPIYLTTPVAYVTSLPKDPFEVFNGVGPNNVPVEYRIAGWAYKSSNGGPTGVPILGANVTFIVNAGSGLPADDIQYSVREANQTSIQYCLFSPGPGNSANSQHLTDNNSDNYPQPHRLWYDPTNGTVSRGYITRETGGTVSP